MKITDLFSRIPKGGSDTESGKAARLIKPVQPVGQVGRLSLVPGQLLQGEVVGEDANGLLLLKLAGETIAARTAIKLEAGQHFWFEVKEAGDSPLLDLASHKGAVLDLLKDIMATRPLLAKAPATIAPQASPVPPGQTSGGEGSLPLSATSASLPQIATGPGGQGLAAPSQVAGAAPLAVLAADGSLPPEAARLVRALVAYMDEMAVSRPGPAEKGGPQQSPPLLKTIVSLIREGQIPVSLQKFAAFKDVVQPGKPLAASLPPDSPASGLVRGDGDLPPLPSAAPAANQPPSLAASAGPAAAAPDSFSPATLKILNALVAVAGVKAPVDGEAGGVQPALNPDRNLGEILTLIARQDKIPPSLLKLGPLQGLLGSLSEVDSLLQSGPGAVGLAGKNDLAAQELPAAGALLPLQFSAAQQAGESLPAQLRLLASLMGLGARDAAQAGLQEIGEMFGRLSEAEMPAAARKLASFFEAHSRVNAEAGPQGQSDFYIMPSIFTGQAGWGEWLWSREHSGDDNKNSGQENLVFFLEMSNLGALTIQVILKDKRLRGQIVMSDKAGSELVTILLPGLMERLEAFGYDVVDFSCSCKSLNVMQELKESLYSQAGSGPASLLDVQA